MHATGPISDLRLRSLAFRSPPRHAPLRESGGRMAGGSISPLPSPHPGLPTPFAMSKRHSPRAARLGDEIQRELMTLLREEVKDPRVGRVTVTHVEVTPDLSHAKVLVTDLSGREHAAETVAALGRTAGFLRSALAHRLSTYTVPQLAFVYDDSIESGIALSRLIDQAVAQDRKRGS